MTKQGPAASEETQSRLRKRSKQKRRQADDDLVDVMRSAAGRRFVWRFIDTEAGVFGGAFASGTVASPEQLTFNEGRRAVGIELMREAQRVATADYILMIQEALSTQLEDETHRVEAMASAETDE